MTATLCGLGGVRAVIAEHLLLKQQLIVVRRPRQRAPRLTASDRLLFGFGALFLSPGRIRKVAIGVRLSVSNSLSGRGVVARIVTGPHDAHRQDPHQQRAVIRFRISQPRTASLPCHTGLRRAGHLR